MSEITLLKLFHEFPLEVLSGELGSTCIRGVVADSRLVKPGDLFVATVGGTVNSHRFIPQAMARGAAAVVGIESGIKIDIPYVRVENSRLALAYLSAAFNGYPARNLTIIGVTGTDGKTTTCSLLYEILIEAGIKVGLISTVNAVIGDDVMDTGFHVTTPESPVVQQYLRKMISAGLTHVVLETTSHGWEQHRVDACEIDIGVVTNITHEHLDEHGTYENYRAAKARLIESLGLTKPKENNITPLAVLNADDESYGYLKSKTPVKNVSYSLVQGADVFARDLELKADGSRFVAVGPGWDVPVDCRIPGAYNVSNCLAALTVSILGLGIDPSLAAQGIANLFGIPGRMEPIDLGQKFCAIVDFAHTPNALKVALETARTFTNGRVIAVFGSAGLRDIEKRRKMAEISTDLADVTILTAEDPRTEPLDQILAEMALGAESRGGVEDQNFFRVPDRADAFRKALSLANSGDVVISCGKGHEQSMCFGEIEYSWDDRLAMRAALAEYLQIPGPEMPYLPTNKPGK